MKNYNNIYKIIHPDGYLFIIIFTIATSILFSISQTLGIIGAIITVFCAYFFRNPIRVTPSQDGLIISPADGIITNIQTVSTPSDIAKFFNDKKMIRVSIFLSIFNAHINRIPITGKILKLHYVAGKFFNASFEKASAHNERQIIIIENESYKMNVAIVQIAGLIARRIICDLEEGQDVQSGEKFGLIRFGSRVDLYLPEKTILSVSKGQTSIAGETIIADFLQHNKEPMHFIKN